MRRDIVENIIFLTYKNCKIANNNMKKSSSKNIEKSFNCMLERGFKRMDKISPIDFTDIEKSNLLCSLEFSKLQKEIHPIYLMFILGYLRETLKDIKSFDDDMKCIIENGKHKL